MPAKSQITTTIWGMSLGSTTMSEAEKIIKKNGFIPHKIDNTLYVHAFPGGAIGFGGQNWDLISLGFIDGYLAEASFSNTYKGAPNLQFEQLKESLNKKYSQYKTSANAPNSNATDLRNFTHYYGYEQYFDGKTLITLSEFEHQNHINNINVFDLHLIYSNYALKIKAEKDKGLEQL